MQRGSVHVFFSCSSLISLRHAAPQDLPTAARDLPPSLAALVTAATILQEASKMEDTRRSAQATKSATSLNQAISAFAALEKSSVSGTVDPAQLRTARQHFQRLSNAMVGVAGEHESAKHDRRKAEQCMYALVLVTAVCGALLHPGALALVAAQAPGVALNQSEFLNSVSLSAVASVPGVASLLALRQRSSAKDAEFKLREAERAMHRKLYLIVLDALRSNYRHHPSAAQFARLTMDMAEAVKSAALENWRPGPNSYGIVDRELNSLVKGWLKPDGEDP
ncbi:hypothetical protein C8A03DRAFT_35394 [Achaetomium macrosporum]|uniref:Uncharacterized protein n=1 Tax=Achaetomium macrosporum TaxID=79813 RepID=A0AAN7HE24_9PEZI|nr:hypothetical protein C8A03DRAFT_35394 [Achaetomium macrosporum]